MMVRLVTHAANQAHQAVGIGFVHLTMTQGLARGSELIAGGDDGDPEARPYRNGWMAHGGAEADLRRREVISGEQASGPFAQVLALLPNESSADGCGQGHHAVSDFAALDREDGIGAGGIGAPVMMRTACPGSSGAMSSCAAAATVL